MPVSEASCAAEIAGLLRDSVLLDDPASISAFNMATFPARACSLYALRVGSVADLRAVLAHCTNRRWQVHVVSQGKNWGFGSRLPVADVELLLDLSPMDRILAYDARYGTVRVQPGVRFGQLCDYLRGKGSRHFLNVTGGDPGSSVLGNILTVYVESAHNRSVAIEQDEGTWEPGYTVAINGLGLELRVSYEALTTGRSNLLQ